MPSPSRRDKERTRTLIQKLTNAYIFRKRCLGVYMSLAGQKGRGFLINNEKLIIAQQAFIAADKAYGRLLKKSRDEATS